MLELFALGAAPGAGGVALQCLAACWAPVPLPEWLIPPIAGAVAIGLLWWVADVNKR